MNLTKITFRPDGKEKEFLESLAKKYGVNTPSKLMHALLQESMKGPESTQTTGQVTTSRYDDGQELSSKKENVLTLKDNMVIESNDPLEEMALQLYKDDTVMKHILSERKKMREEERVATMNRLQKKQENQRVTSDEDSIAKQKRWWQDLAEIAEAMNRIKMLRQGLVSYLH